MAGGVITTLEVQKRNKKRVNVYLDGEYAFSLSIGEAAKLHKGQILDDAEVESLQADDEVQRAMDSAARFLSYRPRSNQEVRQNLTRKGIPDPVVETAMARLTLIGYLDDRAFAEFWVRDRNTFKPLSPQALRYELRQKGIAEAIIADVLEQVDTDDAAYRAASSQSRRLRGSTRRDFREKLLTVLQRRGFAYRDAKEAIRRLGDELDAEGDFFTDDDENANDFILPDSD